MLTTFIAFICDKSLAYHGSNTSLTYHLQNKHSLQYSKLQLAKSASFNQLTAAASSTSKQTTWSQFFRRSDQPASATVQHDTKISLAKLESLAVADQYR